MIDDLKFDPEAMGTGLYYHLIWATQGSEPLLTEPAQAEALIQIMQVQSTELEVTIHALHVMPDHVHLVCSTSPEWSIDALVQTFKRTSRLRLNQRFARPGPDGFAWHEEYGLRTFAESELPEIVAYVQSQRERHAIGDLWSAYEVFAAELPARGHHPPA